MLEVGWSEILVIAVVLIVVVGPKDLPPMLRAFGKMTTKLRTMAGQFQTQFSEALKEADMDDVRKTLQDAQKLNPINTIREAITPIQQVGNELKAELQKSVSTPLANPTVFPAEPVVSEGDAATDTTVLSDLISAPGVAEQAPATAVVATAQTPAVSTPAASIAQVTPPPAVPSDAAPKMPAAKKPKQPEAQTTAEAPQPKPKRASKPKSEAKPEPVLVATEEAIKPKKKKADKKAALEGDA